MKYKYFEDIIHAQAETQPDKIYLKDICLQRKMSYRELEQVVHSKCIILEKLGLEKNSKVIFMMKNSVFFAEYFYAVTSRHAIVTPVNPYIKKRELDYVIQDLQADFIITDRELERDLLKGYETELTVLEDGIRLYRFKQKDRKKTEDKLDENIAIIMYTSGSTGNAKGVILTYQNLISKMYDICAAHELRPEDIVLCVLPWFHINGLVITMLTPLFAGHEIVVAEKFSVTHFWDWVEKYKITWFSGVPTIYSYLLSAKSEKTHDIRSLRFARSASSSLSVSVLEEFEKRYKVPVIESYGITEGCSQITSNPVAKGKQKPGSVGIAYGNKIKVMDDTKKETACGVSGEVWIKGANITKGYFRRPTETEEAFSDGWFKTGDIGYLDEDGYLFLSGRKKELINRAGEKFSPKEIDEVLYEIQEVELACAIGVPNAVYGEEVVAFIKLKEGMNVTGETIQEYCKTRLSDYKVPKEIFFSDDFPQGENGKIQRLKFVGIYQNYKEKKEK